MYFKDIQRGENKLQDYLAEQIDDFNMQYFDMGEVWQDHPNKDHHPRHWMLTPCAILAEHYSLREIWIGVRDEYLETIPLVVPSPIHWCSNGDKLQYVQDYFDLPVFKEWLDIQLEDFSNVYEWTNVSEEELLQWRKKL